MAPHSSDLIKPPWRYFGLSQI